MITTANYQLRRSTLQDADRIREIIEAARLALRDSNIPQWKSAYPTRDDILSDITSGDSRVFIQNDGQIVATTYLGYKEEQGYTKLIEGSWSACGPYAVIHRFAVDPAFRGRGVAGKLLQACIEEARNKNVHIVRLDTHEHNLAMRKAISKAGFEHRGKILVDGTDGHRERLVYEWVDAETMIESRESANSA